jgi:hypothetical protein
MQNVNLRPTSRVNAATSAGTVEAPKVRTAEEWFDAALPRIESTSIRAWAERNRAHWIDAIVPDKLAKQTEPESSLATYIVLTALG